MAQVKLHTINVATGQVKRVTVDLEGARYEPVASMLPNALSGKTQIIVKSPSGIISNLRVLESDKEVSALHQLEKVIGGQGTITEATVEMTSGNVLDLAAAANGTSISSTKVISGVFTNIATATDDTAEAVRLPAAGANLIKVIKNPQTFAISVFPNAADEAIASGANGAAYILAAGASVSFYTKANGATVKRWFVIP